MFQPELVELNQLIQPFAGLAGGVRLSFTDSG